MDFDEYDYLEKAVEETNGLSSKAETTPNKGKEREKSEKGYRRRERREEDDEYDEERENNRKSSSKKLRSEENNGRDRDRDRDRDRERERSSRRRSRELDSEKERSSRYRSRELDPEKERSSRHRSRELDSEKERSSRHRSRELDSEKERSSRHRSRELDSEKERSSRHRSRELDSEKERSSRHRSRDLDSEKERSSRHRSQELDPEKESRSSKDKEKERERDRERRERDIERRERREKEREKEKEERERSRRSRSQSRLERERERDLIREKERDEGRRFKDKKEAIEPEADPERDQRTVFAYQMPLKATERDVFDFFSQAGKVRDVKLIMDRNSRRSKGVGYIEFIDAMSVPMAIALSGHLFLGQPIMVKPSEAEKNLVQSTASTTGVAGPYGATDRKLYVGNLHFNMTEFQLRQIFEAFGPVELVQLPTDPETGHCKGFGFIQFAQLEHAKAAQSLNGKLEIAGRTIKVSSVTDHVGVQDSGTKAADFDDDDGGGLALNAQSRALLMQKLDRSGTASSVVGSLGVPGFNGSAPSTQHLTLPINSASMLPTQVFSMAPEPIGTPSECLLLKNMFDPATESDPEFDLDIRDDVQEECSKYGPVKHIYVDKNTSGYVYLRFESVVAASLAQQAMHKRWFARKMISAIFLQPYEYDAKFKGAA